MRPTKEQIRLTKKTWESMVARCTNPKHPHYKCYAGRGIDIYKPWMEFSRFLDDVGPRPHRDLFIDRIDNDSGYFPGNVRWATRKQQHRNKRNNHFIKAFGHCRTIAEWAEVTGIGKTTIRQRLVRGWTGERAVSELPSYDKSNRRSNA